MRALTTLAVILSLLLAASVSLRAAAAAQQRDYMPGELLVKFKPAMASTNQLLLNASAGAKNIGIVGKGRIHVMKLAQGLSVEQASAIYEGHPDVEFAEPNYILSAQSRTDDPYFPLQWALQNSGQIVAGYIGVPGADVDAVAAWSISQGGGDVVVAVVDTGCNLNHPDLTANLWINSAEIPDNGQDDDDNGYIDDYNGWDVVDHDNDPSDVTGHGTHVAGIIAARGDNRIGVAGLAWQTRIMPVRFMNAYDRGSTADAITAIEYSAAQGAHIINCSWGGGGYSKALRDTMANTNALFVCAAGNQAQDSDDNPFYPAGYQASNIISVAASDQMDQLAWFSNHGSQSVDVVAPGVRIYSLANSRRIIWQDDFNDDGLTGWITGGYPDSWTVADPPYSSNTAALATSDIGDYANTADMWARSPVLDLGDSTGCTLQFQVVGISKSHSDSLSLEASTNQIDWVNCNLQIGSAIIETGISGPLAYWTPVMADLGFLDGHSQTYLRWRFRSDAAGTATGYYIDNLVLTAAAGDNVYNYMQGTSMAAGFVSGLASLILKTDMALAPLQIKTLIMNSVDLNQTIGERVSAGGRINAFNALTLIEQLSLTAAATNRGLIKLKWTADPTMDIDSQLSIERRSDDEEVFTSVAWVESDAGSYTDAAVTSDTTYYYRIQADIADGDSGYSNQSVATAGQGDRPGSGASGGGCFIDAGGR